MNRFSICRKAACCTQVDGVVARCPECGGHMANSSWIKSTGWIMTIFGAFISVPMIFVIWAFLPVAMDPQGAVATGRFGGTADQALMSVMLLLSALAFGVSLLLFGLPRAIAIKRHPLAKPVTLGAAAIFLMLLFYLGSELPDPSVPGATSASRPK